MVTFLILMKIIKKKFAPNIIIYYQDKLDKELLTKTIYFLTSEDNIENINIVKPNKAGYVFKAEINDKIYYFKKYQNKNFLKIIKDFFRPERAVRSLKISIHLKRKNIPTVEPILAVVFIRSPIKKKSIFVTEDFDGTELRKYITNKIPFEAKKQILSKIVNLYCQLLKNHFYHQDPDLQNFLIKQNRIVLVDVDSIRKFPFFTWKIILKNLINFNQQLIKVVTIDKNSNFTKEDRDYIIRNILKNLRKNIDLQETIDFLNEKSLEKN